MEQVRIIDPASKYFGLVCQVFGIQYDLSGRISCYLARGATTGEMELQPYDVQRYFGRTLSTQLEFHWRDE